MPEKKPKLHHRIIHKVRNRPRKTINLKKTSVFLVVITTLAISLYTWSVISTNPIINFQITEEERALVDEPKPEQKWWDIDWKSSIQLKIANLTSAEVQKGQSVRYVFSHKDLVDQGRSQSDGKDLRVVYQDRDNNFQVLNYGIQGLNSDQTEIYFETPEALADQTNNYRYSIYYNNKNVSSNNYLNQNIDKTFNRRIAVSFLSTVSGPFEFKFNRKWVLKSEKLGVEYNTLKGTVQISKDFQLANSAFSWDIQNTTIKSLENILPSDGIININIDSANLSPGNHTLRLRLDQYQQSYDFIVSYPLYTTWTMDWEGFDIKNEYLNNIETIANTNGMPITHFFNPRIYTTNMITDARRVFLTDWVKNRKAKNGDEISMHLHMFNDFVQAAGVTPRMEPSWASQGDGYDVLTTAYPPEEFELIVNYGLKLFKDNGLQPPTGYRAGGWFMNLENLKVLNKLGFDYDSSGRESYTFGKNRAQGFWKLTSTTKPYRISVNDQNSSKAPTMNLWEFPDNGLESTNIPGTEMIKRLQANFSGKPLTQTQVLTFLSHPHWFSTDKPKMEALFLEMNKYQAKNDSGPIVYTTIEKAYEDVAK
jgi:hypothetical protein